jgi:hypothetical protein
MVLGIPRLDHLDSAPTRMSSGEVAVHSGHRVLAEVDDTILLIVYDPRGILGQEFRDCFHNTSFSW